MSLITETLQQLLMTSSLLLLVIGILFFIIRKLLISLAYSRQVILRLWIAFPIAIISSIFVMKLISYKIITSPLVISVTDKTVEDIELIQDFSWIETIIAFWGLVAIIKLTLFIRKYWRIRRIILNQINPVKANIFYSDINLSPLAIGLFKPKVVIPRYLLKELNSEELDLVIQHELIHCRRKDPFWRIVLETMFCLYWFLPFKNKVSQALMTDQEISCDQKVVNQSQQLSTYAELLLKLNLNLHKKNEFNPSLLCSSSLKIKERIMKLNQEKNNNHQKTVTAGFLLLVFVVSTAVALPKIAKDNQDKIQLTPINKASPFYPRSAAIEKIAGEVKLSFIVTTEGKVKDVKVIESKPGDIFVKEAIRAMKKWAFEPIEKEIEAQQVIRFTLD